jgi:porphobilinogen deaminase
MSVDSSSAAAPGAPSPLVVIGSRKSELAMWQAREVERLLHAHPRNNGGAPPPAGGASSPSSPALSFVIRTEASTGDRVLDQSLASLAAACPGIFTKELEAGLLGRVYDVAVHSLKDVPTTLPAGLLLAGVGRREDPRDALVVAARHMGSVRSLADLPAGSVVGTSSLRREAMVRRDYPALTVVGVRGNLNTRLRKLDGGGAQEGAGAEVVAEASTAAATTRAGQWSAGGGGGDTASAAAAAPAADPQSSSASSAPPTAPQAYDALVLATAGLVRMGWEDRITSRLSAHQFPYGVSQGSLGIECREDDARARALARSLTHGPSALRCLTERAFLNRLQGGCQVPIGVHSFFDGEEGQEGEEGDGGGAAAAAAAAAAASPAQALSAATGPRRTNPLPAQPPADEDGWPAAPERVRTLTVRGTVLAVDGSRCITASASEPVIVPDADAETGTVVTRAQWERMCEDGLRVGRALAERLVKAGAEEILGPLTAPRAATYGAAEAPLDRPEAGK